jgi:uncharacterized protein (TIGR03435 family)
MNAIQLLSSQPWVERLGSTLLHFLWQGALIAALYAVARKSVSRAGANVRYFLACAALAMMAAAPVVTWSLLGPPTPEPLAAPGAAPVAAAASAAARNLSAEFAAALYPAAPSPVLSCVVVVWLAGAVALWLRLIGGWIVTERLRYRLARPAPAKWQQTLDRLKTRIHVSQPVRLAVSTLVRAPAVIGWIRPVVLTPAGALLGLPAGQVEAILLHELTHIRRHDYLANMLQCVVEAMLFYHPAVWWVSGHMRAERELCCDDLVVSVSGDAVTYARALAGLESARVLLPTAATAATGGSLAHRISRLLGESRPPSRTASGSGILATGALLSVAALALFGQPAPRPKFEVASIKPNTQPSFQMVRPLPGRLIADAGVRLLIQNAYGVQPFQIVGLPEWVDSTRFAIEAKAAGNAGRAQLFLMLQSLLEDRFGLKIHHETRELPVYALVVAKNGPKLPSPKDGSCTPPEAGEPSEWAGGRMAPPGQGATSLPACGAIRISLGASGPRMQGGQVTTAELARTLSLAVSQSVIDRTGLKGVFDVQLHFNADETTPALPPFPPGSAPAVEMPSLPTALQEQLGLRLESTKGPVDVIVIDRLERPSEN